MRSGLQLRTSQQLTITPQLQRAIQMLQLSSLELDAELHQALEENVFLETDDPPATDIPETREYVGPSAAAPTGGALPEREQAAPSETLHEHLTWQIGMMPLSDEDMAVADYLIDAIGDDGLLLMPVAELRKDLRAEGVTPQEFEAVRQVIMGLDPIGCGAVDVCESLAAQLQRLSLSEDCRACAMALLGLGLEAIAAANVEGLAARLGHQPATVEASLAVLGSLHPRPGSLYGQNTSQYIVPDVLVRRRQGSWIVELNPDILPRLKVNTLYERLLSEQGGANSAMQGQLQEARWLVRSLEMRNDTLLKVAGAIMRHQAAFLDQGEIAMRPMVLEEIASAIEMHESTISRVTTNKYIHTPRGVFELKYFFSSRLATRGGGRCSSTAVRALIRQIVDAEPVGQPLSDGRIAELLAERGVRIARRTVAKYREALGIAPVSERQAGAG